MTTSLQNRSRRVFAARILHLIGYGLLLVAAVNIALSIAPWQSINPLEEFPIGRIIEKMPLVLLGMVLVYYQQSDRTSIEVTILKTLSWLSLASAILLLAIIPLNISNSWLIYHRQNVMPGEVTVDRNPIQQFKEQLEAANSQAEIGAVLQQQVAPIDISDLVNVQQLKDNILTDLSSDRDTITSQRAFRAEKRSMLLKNCLRWNLGALVASTLFFTFWQSSRKPD